MSNFIGCWKFLVTQFHWLLKKKIAGVALNTAVMLKLIQQQFRLSQVNNLFLKKYINIQNIFKGGSLTWKVSLSEFLSDFIQTKFYFQPCLPGLNHTHTHKHKTLYLTDSKLFCSRTWKILLSWFIYVLFKLSSEHFQIFLTLFWMQIFKLSVLKKKRRQKN